MINIPKILFKTGLGRKLYHLSIRNAPRAWEDIKEWRKSVNPWNSGLRASISMGWHHCYEYKFIRWKDIKGLVIDAYKGKR